MKLCIILTKGLLAITLLSTSVFAEETTEYANDLNSAMTEVNKSASKDCFISLPPKDVKVNMVECEGPFSDSQWKCTMSYSCDDLSGDELVHFPVKITNRITGEVTITP